MSESVPHLLSELARLRERIELQHRHIETIERRIREGLKNAGQSTETAEALPPLSGAGARRSVVTQKGQRPDPTYWPTPTMAERPLVPSPGLANLSIACESLKVLGISVCGFERSPLEYIVDMVDCQLRESRDFAPVFLTDSTETDIFRSRGFIFEYLPPPERRTLRGTMLWNTYAAERLQLLRRKWNMARIIVFGGRSFGRPSVERGGAQYRLAELYLTGRGVPKDPAEAVRWLRQAAEQGYADAQYWLGSLSRTGRGVAKDLDDAVKWLRHAAAQGHVEARQELQELGISG